MRVISKETVRQIPALSFPTMKKMEPEKTILSMLHKKRKM